MLKLTTLRDAGWLTADRSVAFSRILLLVWVGLIASIPWTAPDMFVARDFGAFWTATQLAVHGHAADAYRDPARAALTALFGAPPSGRYPPFFYPPTAFLLWSPFTLMPFVTAAAVWIGVTLAAYAVAIRAVARTRPLTPILAFPAVLVCTLYGQNSFFTTALFGAAALTLGRLPIAAGICLGCLTYKPQLAVLAPLYLACAGRWRELAAALITAISLVAASAALFGLSAWSAFTAALPEASAWNADGIPGFDKFASPYAAMRVLGASATVAWTTQAATTALALVTLTLISRRRPGGGAEIACLVVATGFCVPFLGIYDLVIFAVPAAWLISEATRTGWLPYERALLAMLYLSPIPIVAGTPDGLPLAPIALAILAALVLRRSGGRSKRPRRHDQNAEV